MVTLKELKWLIKGQAVVVRKPTYSEEGLATRHNCDFMNEPLFRRAYAAGDRAAAWGSPNHWRVFVECWAASHGTKLEGDFVQCGVNRGRTARAIIEYVDFKTLPKRFYLMDTYCGLVDDQISPAERHKIPHYEYDQCYEEVRKTFAPFPNVELVRGPIPDTLNQVPSARIAFLSIDMNCTLPEIAAAEFFWPRTSSGALIVLDDYGWLPHIEQKRAFDEFAARRDVTVLPLPTGQGIILKP